MVNWIASGLFALFGVYLAFTSGLAFAYAEQLKRKRRWTLIRLAIGLWFVGFSMFLATRPYVIR